MHPEIKRIIDQLSPPPNTHILEDYLENICKAVVLECARMIESRETVVRSHSMTRGMADNLTAVREDILNHFGVKK